MLTQNDIYPTRGEQERLSERKDPVVYGRSYYHNPLSKEELVHYERNGFVIIPGVFGASEIASLVRILPHLTLRNALQKRGKLGQELPPGESETLFAPEKTSTFFRNLAQERRILSGCNKSSAALFICTARGFTSRTARTAVPTPGTRSSRLGTPRTAYRACAAQRPGSC